ncbi:MAG: hypothetical protein HON90_10665 [Halobacteriovoraceae bacterium]|jgi:hypothetical protein|nr:hypothetical protein [Halobacteriovoraceae bacterium]
MKKLLLTLVALSLFFSCLGGGGSGDSSSSENTINISGTMGTAAFVGNGLLEKGTSALDLSALKMYCVAFNASVSSGSSDFGAGGQFDVAGIPTNTPFGCFVVAKSDSKIIATIKIKDSNTGMSDESSSSMKLGSSVSLGSITLTEGNPVIEVPKAVIASAQSTSTSSAMAVDDFHNTAWTLTCVDTADSDCSSFVTESPQVFFRIISATKSSTTIYGIGVWASQAAFGTCGSVDMTTTEASDITTEEGGGFTWTQNTQGAFTNASSTSDTCPLRDAGTASTENLSDYYTLNKLVISGSTFSLNDEDSGTNGSCEYYHKTALTMNSVSATEMYGSFETAEIKSSGCGSVTDDRASFVVKFTKQ